MKAHLPPKRAKGRWYCGPHAIAVITGRSFETVRAAINEHRGRAAHIGVTGMWSREVEAALNTLGYGMDTILNSRAEKVCNRLSLSHWLKHPRHEGRVYLVELTTHFVIVTDDWLIDNHTKGKVDIHFAPHRRSKVTRVFSCFRMNGAGWGNSTTEKK